MLMGGQVGATVKLLSTTISFTAVNPTDSNAGIRYSNAAGGPTQKAEGATLTWSNIDSWLLSGAVADVEFRATVVTGPSTPTGTIVGTWINASVLNGPNWYVQQTVTGSKGCVLTIEARRAVGLADLGTSSVTLRAIVTP